MKRLLLAAAASTMALIAVEFRTPAMAEIEVNAGAVRAFDSDKRVDSVLHRACANCHSYETKIPWFGRCGPVAWVIRRDVERARERLNFSEQGSLSENEREEIYEALADHSMPPRTYTVLHPEARISKEDLALLERWSRR